MTYVDIAACALKYAEAEQQVIGDTGLPSVESLLRARLARGVPADGRMDTDCGGGGKLGARSGAA